MRVALLLVVAMLLLAVVEPKVAKKTKKAPVKKALAAPAKKTLALTTVSLPQYLALFAAAGVSLLSGASVVHNILQPDLVRNSCGKSDDFPFA